MRSIEIKNRAFRELVNFICYEFDMLDAEEIIVKDNYGTQLDLKLNARKNGFSVNGKDAEDESFDTICVISDLVEGIYLSNMGKRISVNGIIRV